MTTSGFQIIALILMIVSLPLLSWGTTNQMIALTLSGVALLVVGVGSLTVLRYFPSEED